MSISDLPRSIQEAIQEDYENSEIYDNDLIFENRNRIIIVDEVIGLSPMVKF